MPSTCATVLPREFSRARGLLGDSGLVAWPGSSCQLIPDRTHQVVSSVPRDGTLVGERHALVGLTRPRVP